MRMGQLIAEEKGHRGRKTRPDLQMRMGNTVAPFPGMAQSIRRKGDRRQQADRRKSTRSTRRAQEDRRKIPSKPAADEPAGKREDRSGGD
jgi:hypothetical protein